MRTSRFGRSGLLGVLVDPLLLVCYGFEGNAGDQEQPDNDIFVPKRRIRSDQHDQIIAILSGHKTDYGVRRAQEEQQDVLYNADNYQVEQDKDYGLQPCRDVSGNKSANVHPSVVLRASVQRRVSTG